MRLILCAPACALFALSLTALGGAQAQQPATPATPQQPTATAPAEAPATAPATPATPQQPIATAPAEAPAAAPATPATGGRTSVPVDRIVAVVNDEVITANELRYRIKAAMTQLQRAKIQPPPPEVLERQVLERMIIDRAQLQLARETGVRVDDATVNAAIGRIAEANNMSVPALRQRVEAEGVSFNQFRDDVRQDIVLNRLREREVEGKLQISESELDNFIAEQACIPADA